MSKSCKLPDRIAEEILYLHVTWPFYASLYVLMYAQKRHHKAREKKHVNALAQTPHHQHDITEITICRVDV